MSTISNAVATRDNSPASMIEQYKGDFAVVLPSHVKAETWARLAVGAFRRDPKLAEAFANNPGAGMNALLTAARLGLEPGTEQYYLTPRKVKGRSEVLGIVGYQGEIELIYRAGAVSSVIVEVVRERDRFEYSPGRHERPIHEIDWDAEDRGDLRLAYAYAIMKDGATSKVVVLNRGHIATAKASSQGADSEYSPWKRHEEAMWLKTAAHRLAKWVPTSAEFMREQLRAIRDVHNEAQASIAPALQPLTPDLPAAPAGVDEETGEFVDAEVVDESGDGNWPAEQPGGGQ